MKQRRTEILHHLWTIIIRSRSTALMSTDIAGHSPEMKDDFIRLNKILKNHREMVESAINEHRGSVLHNEENAFLAKFLSLLDALRCTFAIEEVNNDYNRRRKDPEKINIRVGLHLGRPDFDDSEQPGGDLLAAVKAQELAEPGEVCASETFLAAVQRKTDVKS